MAELFLRHHRYERTNELPHLRWTARPEHGIEWHAADACERRRDRRWKLRYLLRGHAAIRAARISHALQGHICGHAATDVAAGQSDRQQSGAAGLQHHHHLSCAAGLQHHVGLGADAGRLRRQQRLVLLQFRRWCGFWRLQYSARRSQRSDPAVVAAADGDR